MVLDNTSLTQPPPVSTSIETYSIYLPLDRRWAVAQQIDFPEEVEGAALFADISGFTPLTEALVRELGGKRGAEELTRHLNLVYDALIHELHQYGGSVISFSGDAITCWLGDDDGERAITCALAMQQAMQQFTEVIIPSGKTVSLAMKTAVAVGSARRFVVGDPTVQLIDVLAGATLERLMAAEHQAEQGEVVLDAPAVSSLGERLQVSTWRQDEVTGEYFAVVKDLATDVLATNQAVNIEQSLTEERVRPWLLPPIYQRLRANQGDFLAELRPAVAMFLRFGGIDYDDDADASVKLDRYIRWVQNVLVRYDAYPLQVTVGDKGSYLYAIFGAPIAHEDDAMRAVSAALELRTPPVELNFISHVEIGISQGRMYTGAYGGTERRTYGVLGDDVNLAARLMQAAAPGQILISQDVRQATDDSFVWDTPATIAVKGKTEPITVNSVVGVKARQAYHLQVQKYTLPMVGRDQELLQVEEIVGQVLAGEGQVLGITGEAGLGKSRLVAEAARIATEQHLTGYGGECQSYGKNISYLVWQPIWRGLFGLEPHWTAEEQIRALETRLKAIDPALGQRMPLLSPVLNISIPDNKLTRSFDAKLRKSSLESLLLDYLRAQAKSTPMVLVLEDGHWLDPLSMDLLEIIAQAIINLPVLIIVVYRPLELQQLRPPWAAMLFNYTEIRLTTFTDQNAEQLIRLKLQKFIDSPTGIPAELVKRVTAQAEGNPFYIEELINYLQDQGIDPSDTQAVMQLDLPNSLYSLILSRIDQLSESQNITLKMASIIGRMFETELLQGVHPNAKDPAQIKFDLGILVEMELTSLEASSSETAYMFKHIVTQQVAYESLPYATRAIQHENLAGYIESHYQDQLEQYINLLAYHYERSNNKAKTSEYLRKAGQLAQANYANQAAIDYYQRLLLFLADDEKVEIMLKLGEVLQLVGDWAEASRLYRQTLGLAELFADHTARAWSQVALGELCRKQGDYGEAADHYAEAQAAFELAEDQAGIAQVLHSSGTMAAQQGDYTAAQTLFEASLALRQAIGDKPREAAMLNNLGIIARYQGKPEEAQWLYEQSLDIVRQAGHKWSIAIFLNNLGNLALEQGDYAKAQIRLEEAVALQQEIGDRSNLANALNTLGNVIRAQGDYQAACKLYTESLIINRDLGDRRAIAYLLEDIGCLAALQQQAERALRLVGAAAALRETIGAPLSPADQEKLTQMLEPIRQARTETETTEMLNRGKALSLEEAISQALRSE